MGRIKWHTIYQQQQGVKGNKVDNKGPEVHSQVTSNKPAKKSAGRGR